MSTTITTRGIITRICAVIIRSLQLDGSLPEPIPDGYRLLSVRDVPIAWQVIPGEQVIDRADGVGVIAVHEEDDTLIGADLDLAQQTLDHQAALLICGGTLNETGSQWSAPDISAQRDNPCRFSLDVYTQEISGGYLVHRFHYCKGMLRSYQIALGQAATPGFYIKARPHPQTGLTHSTEFVTELP